MKKKRMPRKPVPPPAPTPAPTPARPAVPDALIATFITCHELVATVYATGPADQRTKMVRIQLPNHAAPIAMDISGAVLLRELLDKVTQSCSTDVLLPPPTSGAKQ